MQCQRSIQNCDDLCLNSTLSKNNVSQFFLKEIFFLIKLSHTPRAPESFPSRIIDEQKLESICTCYLQERFYPAQFSIVCIMKIHNLCLSNIPFKYNRYLLFLFEIGPRAFPPVKCDLLVTKQRYYNKHKNKRQTNMDMLIKQLQLNSYKTPFQLLLLVMLASLREC